MKPLLLKISRAFRSDPLLFVFVCIALVVPSFAYMLDPAIQSYTNYFIDSTKGMSDYFFTWNSYNLGSNSATSLWRIFPLGAFYYIFNNVLNIPNGVTQGLFLLAIRITGFYGIYKLARTIDDHNTIGRRAAVISALFYIYSLYAINYYSSSYIILLPYYILPLQLYIMAKLLRQSKLFIASLVVSLLNVSYFGINLVYDAITFVAMTIFLIVLLIQKKISLRRAILFIALTATLTLCMVSWWLIPMLTSSFNDSKTSTQILSSESFYNLDTKPANILRGLGEWGFFSGSGGTPYHNFAYLYKSNPIITLSGYLLSALALLCLTRLRSIKQRNSKLIITACIVVLVPLLAFIGGTNSAWPTSHLMEWAFGNIPYFMALRNTYKWMSLSMIFVALLMAYSLQFLLKSSRLKQYRRLLIVSILLLITFSAFPLWTGGVYEPSSKGTKLPTYWSNAAQEINKLDGSTRLFLLPNQYFSVYKWGGQRIAYPESLESALFKVPVIQNTCKGCGQYDSSQLTANIYSNLDNKNIAAYLGIINVGQILQRNDYDYKFYKVESPSEIKTILQNQNISNPKTFGELDLYSVPKKLIYSKVYSPETLIFNDDLKSSLDIFNLYDNKPNKLAFTTDPKTLSTNSPMDYYTRLYQSDTALIKDNEIIDSKKVPNMDGLVVDKVEKSMSTYQLEYRYQNGKYEIKFINKDGEIYADKKLVSNNDFSYIKEISSTNLPLAITIDSNSYYLLPTPAWRYLDTASLKNSSLSATIGAIDQTINLLSNPSFEGGSWNKTVYNCDEKSSRPDISAKIDAVDKTEGKQSIQLRSKSDSACIYSNPIKNFDATKTYYVKFDSKKVTGSSPAYCVWDGNSCLKYATIDSKTGQWTTTQLVIKPNTTSKQLVVYIYANIGNYAQTITNYDNFVISPINAVSSETIDLNDFPQSSNSFSSKGNDINITKSLDIEAVNQVENGDFASGSWSKEAGQCSEAGRNATASQEIMNVEGDNYLQINARSVLGCVSSAQFKSFDDNKNYKISFKYNSNVNSVASYCVWDGNSCIKKGDLNSTDGKWAPFQSWFKVNTGGKSLSLYLYANGQKQASSVSYDDVSVQRINNEVFDNYVMKSISKQDNNLQLSDYEQKNPTEYIAKIKNMSSGQLILQESFHPLWNAKISWKDKDNRIHLWRLSPNSHYVANGYANGWSININDIPTDIKAGHDVQFVISYNNQVNFYKGLAITAMTLIISISLLVYITKFRFKSQK